MSYNRAMRFFPSFYFCPFSQPLLLSKEYNICLRAPANRELPLWQQNTHDIFGRLSDKEKRRILYAFYPLGLPKATGSLDEIFSSVICSLWLGLEAPSHFFLSAEEYGALCGLRLGGGFVRSPAGFIAPEGCSPRLFLRALKLNLAPIDAACPDLPFLQHFTLGLDSILSMENKRDFIKRLAQALASPSPTQEATFLKLALAAEIMTADEQSPRSRQFSQKLALIRCIMLKKKGEALLLPPQELEQIFAQCRQTRADVIQGKDCSLGEKASILFSTLRLALELMVEDPLLFFYIQSL